MKTLIAFTTELLMQWAKCGPVGEVGCSGKVLGRAMQVSWGSGTLISILEALLFSILDFGIP